MMGRNVPGWRKLLRKALDAGDDSRALALARQLCGLTYAIRINPTGRVLFRNAAAVRVGNSRFMNVVIIDEGLIRFESSNKPTEDALNIHKQQGSRYVTATRFLRRLGFDGSKPYNIEASPYGNRGFEFRLS
jgi:hypothetical protein